MPLPPEQRPEQRPSPIPVPESGSAPREGYSAFITRSLDRLARDPRVAGAVHWYRERVAGLPKMAVTETALTGKGGWGKEMTSDGEVSKVTGAHFDMLGVQITKTNPDGTTVGWNQPLIVQKEISMTLPSPEGPIPVETSGFVGLLVDPEGNVLLTVGQEPGAQTEKYARVRSPLQTSATKFKALLEGDHAKDPTMADVLDKVGGGRPIDELFASGAIEPFPLAPADDNRMRATNIGVIMKVSDSEVRRALEADGTNRWCSPDELNALTGAGVVNSLTYAASAAL